MENYPSENKIENHPKIKYYEFKAELIPLI